MKRNARVVIEKQKKVQSPIIDDASSQMRHRDTVKELAEKIAVLENRVLALETPRPIPPGYVPL